MQKRHFVRGGRAARLLSRTGHMKPAVDEGGPLMEHCESRTLMDAVFWDGGAGTSNWGDAANWSRNGLDALPVNGDDVTINVGANPTVVFSTGTVTLNSLTTNENLTVTGGTLGVSGLADINATLLLNGGTLSGGTWDTSGGVVRGGSSGTTVNNATFSGDILLDSTSARVRVGGTTRFDTLRLSANGANVDFSPGYVLQDDIVVEGAAAGARSIQGAVGGVGTLTVAATGSIRLAAGSGGNLGISNSSQLTLINNGTIVAEAAGRTLSITSTAFTNNGSMAVSAGAFSVTSATWSNAAGGAIVTNGAELVLGGDWANAGMITSNGGTVELGGAFSTADIGTLNRTGGTVAVSGALDNSAASITLNAATGSWELRAGTITGGTLTLTAGSRLIPTTSGGTLSSVAVAGDLVLDSTSAQVTIRGTTRFGTLRLAANAAGARFGTGYTLLDTVVVEGAAPGARSIQGAVGGVGTFTIGASGVIRLAAGAGGNLSIGDSSTSSLINNGLISAEAAGRTLDINNSSLTNAGTMQVTAGTLTISANNWTNAGAINATNATLSFSGAWSSTGTTSINNATLNLGGSFGMDELGTLSRTGGVVNVTGAADNIGNTFTFNAATGSWSMSSGTITGGTLVMTGAERLIATVNGGSLIDVQLNGEIALDTTSARIRVGGTTRFTAARLAANAASMEFAPNYTLNDLVSVEGAAVGGRTLQGANGGAGTLTIGPTGVIRHAAGAGGNLTISNSSQATIINNGLISMEAAGRTFTINTTGLINNGTVQGSAGTLDITPSSWTNAATGLVSGGASRIDFGGAWSNAGTVTINGTTLNLGGTFTTAGVGVINRTGGVVNLTGTLTNTGATLAFTPTTGSWNLSSGGIIGGTVTISGGARLVPTGNGGSLTDVQYSGELLFDTTSARVRITGTTRFVAARLSANAASLEFTPGYVLHDLVSVEGAAVGSRSIQGASGGVGTLTVSPTGVIRLADGAGGNLTISNSSQLTLVNNGLISAEAAGRTLTMNNTGVTNNGTIRSTMGTLSVTPTSWSNAGLLDVNGGRLDLEGAWTNTGAITLTSGTLNVGGTFTTAGFGSMTRSGGTVNLTGTMNNTATTFTFNAGTGTWNLSAGSVVGGTLVFAGERLAPTSSGGTLTDVIVNGEIVVDVTSGRVRVAGGTRFTTIRLAANAAAAEFGPGYVLQDLVTVEGAAAGSRSVSAAAGGNGVLTIAPTGAIRVLPGAGGNLSISDSSVSTIVNNGLIINEAAGRTVTINNSTFTNNGTVQASAGTVRLTSTTFTNYAKGTLTGGTFNAFGAGVMSLPDAAVVTVNNATIGVGNAASFPAVTTLSTNNGTLQTGGGGTFTITPAGGTLANAGTVRLAPTNVLAIAGKYSQSSGGTMVVQIQGELASDIGRLTVTGNAALAGNLTVQTVNGYAPDCVNLPFLNAGTLTGEFQTQTLPTPVGDHQALTVYIGPEVRFAVSPPSDFNRDGVLNSQDLFDFVTAFFNEDEISDFNNDGIINSQDFFDFITDFFEGCD